MARRRGEIRPGTLAKMSNDQLKRQGYIRIAGFTKKNGDKVKSHIRKLNTSEKSEIRSESLKTLGETAIDFTPIIGDIKAGKEAVDAFSERQYVAGGLLSLAAIVGLVPGAGDVAAKGLKLLAKPFKAAAKGIKGSKPVKAISKSLREGREINRLQQKFSRDPFGVVTHKPMTLAEATRTVKGTGKSASKVLKEAKPTKGAFNVPTRSLKESNKQIAKQTKKDVEKRLARGRPQKGGPFDNIKKRERLIDQEVKQGKGWTSKQLDRVPTSRGNAKLTDNTVNANMTHGFANKPKITSKSFDASFGNAPKSKVVMNPGKKPGQYRNMAEMQAAGKANIKAAVAKARAPMGKSKLVPKKGTTSTIAKDAPKGKPAGFKPKNFAELQARQKAGLKAQANKVNTKPKTLKQKAATLEKKVLAKERSRRNILRAARRAARRRRPKK